MIALLLFDMQQPDQPVSSIYPVGTPAQIELRHSSQSTSILFEQQHTGWQMMRPLQAPAKQSIIDALLASNHYTQRRYERDEIAEPLTEQVVATLLINGHRFDFASTEPVSGLRYVLANNQVYLQPERVAALASASIAALLDTTIAEQVCLAEDLHCQQPTEVIASAIVAHDNTDRAIASHVLKTVSGEQQTLAVYEHDGLIALHRPGTGFRYIISEATAQRTGLSQHKP